MRAIDDFLIDRIYQRIADWAQDWLGVNNFVFARFCCYIAVIALIVDDILSQYLSGATIVLTVTIVFDWAMLFHYEKLVTAQVANGFKNVLRVDWYVLRIGYFALTAFVALCILPILWTQGHEARMLFIGLFPISFSSVFYFAACTPRPPSKGKVKEWLKSTTTTPATLASNSG